MSVIDTLMSLYFCQMNICLLYTSMELLYYYMMRILFKGIAEPDMSIGEIMEQV